MTIPKKNLEGRPATYSSFQLGSRGEGRGGEEGISSVEAEELEIACVKEVTALYDLRFLGSAPPLQVHPPPLFLCVDM